MNKYKTYIMWANYGNEGWGIIFETNDKDELLKNYRDYLGYGDGKVLVTKNIPVVLEIEDD